MIKADRKIFLTDLFTCGFFPFGQNDFFVKYIQSFSINRAEVLQESNFCVMSVTVVFTEARCCRQIYNSDFS